MPNRSKIRIQPDLTPPVDGPNPCPTMMLPKTLTEKTVKNL